jgi:hypothetical protein
VFCVAIEARFLACGDATQQGLLDAGPWTLTRIFRVQIAELTQNLSRTMIVNRRGHDLNHDEEVTPSISPYGRCTSAG